MTWMTLLLVAAAAIAVARIYVKVRAQYTHRQDDWDARTIDRLRKLGSDPFKAHGVDFFFALPHDDACRAVNELLEKEGYVIDIKAAPDSPLPFSLHARRDMRLSVPDMQALSRRFRELAEGHGGRYDGWAADIAK